jgi:hypothetical protein
MDPDGAVSDGGGGFSVFEEVRVHAGESFESSGEAGKGGVCGSEEVVQGQLSDDGL